MFAMVIVVKQNISNGMLGLSRRLKLMQMIAAVENLTALPGQFLNRNRETRVERTHPAFEAIIVISFNEHVKMIRLK